MIPARPRKLIGIFVFLAFLIVYSLIAMAVGARYLSSVHGIWQFLFYAVAGLTWLPGAMAIISWMAKADKQ